ncbi:MAG: TlyA family RNA methyltransferase [Solirubrobacteraceae bacterium]
MTASTTARPYVSRGGVKLESALVASGLPVAGRRAIDVGASTGGFTDCLLRAGATEVIAVDVGYGQFDWALRNDPRVHVRERTNARELVADTLPYAPDLAVLDVSFISIAKILPALLACLAERHDVLALVKPQFEVGRGRVGKGGVVRRADHRREALLAVAGAARQLGQSVLGFHPAGLHGPKGNRETFVWLAEGARAGQVAGAVGPGGAHAGASSDVPSALIEMALLAEPADGA